MTVTERFRVQFYGILLFVGFFASLLWILHEVMKWVFAVLKATR
jgi:hypothetical protein